jgi:type IV pilus assembly protein PilW
MLISLAAISIFMVAAYAVLSPLTRSYTAQDVAVGVQQTVRMAVEYIVQDLRLAGLDPLGSAGAGLEEANATSVQFSLDRVREGEQEANGVIENDNLERITYFYDVGAKTLRYRLYSGAPVQTSHTLVENVTNFRLRYFDSDGNVTSILEDIVFIEVFLAMEEEAGLEGTVERSYSTRVRCRNLGI